MRNQYGKLAFMEDGTIMANESTQALNRIVKQYISWNGPMKVWFSGAPKHYLRIQEAYTNDKTR